MEYKTFEMSSPVIGNDIYFYPTDNGNILSLTKEYSSFDKTPTKEQNVIVEKVDFLSTFYLTSIAVIGLFALFQLSRKH
jgi:hypothetical protein